MRVRHCVLALFVAVMATSPALARQGTVLEDLVLDSRAMQKDVRYVVYLPPGYEESTRRYPVVYLLHGYGGNEATWLQFYEMDRRIDVAIASGELPPMIVVMPDGGTSWYIDSHDGKVRWETMFLTELMPLVEATYRVRAGRQFRGIAGLSMGGFGALTQSMRHPDLFAAAAALSPATGGENGGIVDRAQDGYDRMFAPAFGLPGLEGEARLTETFETTAPPVFLPKADLDQVKRVRYWIDCGDDDFLSSEVSRFHFQMLDLGVPHEYRVRDGGHTGDYWRTGLVPALAYIAESFKGVRP